MNRLRILIVWTGLGYPLCEPSSDLHCVNRLRVSIVCEQAWTTIVGVNLTSPLCEPASDLYCVNRLWICIVSISFESLLCEPALDLCEPVSITIV